VVFAASKNSLKVLKIKVSPGNKQVKTQIFEQ